MFSATCQIWSLMARRFLAPLVRSLFNLRSLCLPEPLVMTAPPLRIAATLHLP